MDSFSTLLAESLIATIVALRPDSGVSVALRDAHDEFVECARGGDPLLSSSLPSLPASSTRAGNRSSTEEYIILSVPLRERSTQDEGILLGIVRIVFRETPPAGLIAALEALAAHAAIALEQNELHRELQHSFNGLFIVYEAGNLLNFSHTVKDIVGHVVRLLTHTLHFRQCAVMLLSGNRLRPAAHAGLDGGWARRSSLPFDHSVAARVVKAGVPVAIETIAELDGIRVPKMASGALPACILCAPLTTRSGTLGALEVYWDAPEPISDDALFVVSVLAVETAAALENARLYEELREREERLTQYAGKLVNSQEEERRRISRDIHDGLGQMIVSAFQYLQAHEYSLPEDHPRDAFRRGLLVLQECIRETRRVMSDLRPSTLDDFGLVVALQQQLDAAAREAGWEAGFLVDGSLSRLAPVIETTVFRVVQEALNNARKHAGAERVSVRVDRRADEIVVEVRDWGCGFAVEGVAVRPERGQHLGLMGMRERVSLLGGTVEIQSNIGDGTNVRIVLPVATYSEAAAS